MAGVVVADGVDENGDGTESCFAHYLCTMSVEYVTEVMGLEKTERDDTSELALVGSGERWLGLGYHH